MTEKVETAPRRRLHDLDALRGFAMVLGIALHGALAFFPTFWPVQDAGASYDGWFDEFFHAIHGFRMPLFFLLSGFFTTMLWRRRGLQSLVWHRVRRIAFPLALAFVTIVPAVNWSAEQVSADQFPDLLSATFFQNERAVERLLEDGLPPDEPKGDSGDSPLHVAALVDNAAIARILLDGGADPFVLDADGETVLAYAYFAGSEDVATVLVEYGFPDIRPPGGDWQDLDEWGSGEAFLDEVLGLDSWITSFHHLWFLWFLLWLVGGFALVALVAQRGRSQGRSKRVMWALIPLTLVPQLMMGDGGTTRTFGPDTSTGVVPIWHVLAYYAIFFAFGALLYGRGPEDFDGLMRRLTRMWPVVLGVAVVVVLPIGLGVTFEGGPWSVASMLQVVYTWGMIAGLMGLFGALLAKERRGVRYLSDASYWLYLAHVPLVMLVQSWVRDWDVPSGLKFVIVVGGVTVFLLGTYQFFVRYTPLGTLLNGKRERPRRWADGT